MSKDKERAEASEATLEALRLRYTDLSQDDFVSACGLTRSTYRRWVSEKKPPRLTPEQIIQICNVCKVSVDIFFRQMGAGLGELTQKKPFDELHGSKMDTIDQLEHSIETDSLEMAQAKAMATVARKLKVSLKVLFDAFGVDTTGIPDDISSVEQEPPARPDD